MTLLKHFLNNNPKTLALEFDFLSLHFDVVLLPSSCTHGIEPDMYVYTLLQDYHGEEY